MLRRPRSLDIAWNLAGWMVVMTGARADAAIERVHLTYDAEAGCPDRAKFVEEILTRAPRARLAEPTEADRAFFVKLRPAGSGFVGRLEIRAATQATTSREVVGPSCQAVASALALVAAVAIDPESARSGKTAADQGTPSSDPRGATWAPSPPPSGEQAATSTAPASGGASWRVGAQAESTLSMAPSAAFGGAVFGELAPSRDDGGKSVRAQFGLSLVRVAAHYGETATVRRAGGAASFEWAALDLEACILRVRFARGLDLRACGAFEGGALRGRGEQVPLSKTPLRPWWSVTPQLRLQWFFARSWFVDADGGLVVPLRRESFVFEDPTTTFHEVPVLGSRWAIGLGYGLGGP